MSHPVSVRFLSWIAGALSFGLAPGSGDLRVQTFENARVGSLPAGWSVAMTHEGGAPRWQTVRDSTAPSPTLALAQLSADATAGRFPLAVWDVDRLKDGEVSVWFKPVSGAVDQAAGLVWRYQDPQNYYIARANALEKNVAAYRVEKGTRVSLEPKGMPSRSYGVKVDVQTGRWQKLRVVFHDSVFVIYWNDQRLFETEDRTFGLAGRTGLWTKADSQTWFDNFTVVRAR